MARVAMHLIGILPSKPFRFWRVDCRRIGEDRRSGVLELLLTGGGVDGGFLTFNQRGLRVRPPLTSRQMPSGLAFFKASGRMD